MGLFDNVGIGTTSPSEKLVVDGGEHLDKANSRWCGIKTVSFVTFR